jgi:hypothetical protein
MKVKILLENFPEGSTMIYTVTLKVKDDDGKVQETTFFNAFFSAVEAYMYSIDNEDDEEQNE